MSFFVNPTESIHLIHALICPVKWSKYRRRVCSPAQIKALYQLHQYEKNVLKGKWEITYRAIPNMAKDAGISERSFQRLLNGDDFQHFGTIIKRPHQTSLISLRPSVVKAFLLLEKAGLFKGFTEDFYKWREYFEARMKGLLSITQSGKATLIELLTYEKKKRGGDLSTSEGSCVSPSKKLACHPIKTLEVKHMKNFSKEKLITREIQCCSYNTGKISSELRRESFRDEGISGKNLYDFCMFKNDPVKKMDSLLIHLGDVFGLSQTHLDRLGRFHSLYELENALIVREGMRGIKPTCQAKVFNACITAARKNIAAARAAKMR